MDEQIGVASRFENRPGRTGVPGEHDLPAGAGRPEHLVRADHRPSGELDGLPTLKASEEWPLRHAESLGALGHARQRR